MPVQLPFVASVPDYRVATVLNDQTYIFDVRWNGRESAWYFDLLAEDETPIRRGIKVVLGVTLGGRVRAEPFPRGALIASDLSGANIEAGLDDIGTRVAVYWYSPAELAELVSG